MKAVLEIVKFNVNDVITTSNTCPTNTETPCLDD